MRDNYAVVILAAGAAKRFGSNKLMASYNGKPLFLHTLEKVASLEGVLKLVVTGTDEISEYAREKGFLVVRNDSPEEGITRSLKLGLERCLRESKEQKRELDGVLFCVCDQPEVKIETIQGIFLFAEGQEKNRTLLSGDRRDLPSTRIICAGTKERRGNPVYFGSAYFEELLKLSGDQGGKQIMRKYPENVRIFPVSSIELFDVDTILDLEKLSWSS